MSLEHGDRSGYGEAELRDEVRDKGNGQIMLGLLSHVEEFVLHLKSNRKLLHCFKHSNKIMGFFFFS